MYDENSKKYEQLIKNLPLQLELIDDILKQINRKIRLVNWVITISIAVFGFFISMLIQIKFHTIIPYKYIAICAIVFIILSILMGVYNRISLGCADFTLNSSKIPILSGNLIKKISGEYPPKFNKRIDSMYDRILMYMDYSIFKKDITLIVLFCLGTVLTIIYFFIYLFFSTTCKI